MNDFSKLASGMARHLATRKFWIHILQREPFWICSLLTTKDFQDWFVKACIRTGLPPCHQWLFDSYVSKTACLIMLATSPPMISKNDFSKLVSLMARYLATREFWIHIHQSESVWICSPPRHHGFSRLICLNLYQNWFATSPPMTFWFIWYKESLFEYARHLGTNDF